MSRLPKDNLTEASALRTDSTTAALGTPRRTPSNLNPKVSKGLNFQTMTTWDARSLSNVPFLLHRLFCSCAIGETQRMAHGAQSDSGAVVTFQPHIHATNRLSSKVSAFCGGSERGRKGSQEAFAVPLLPTQKSRMAYIQPTYNPCCSTRANLGLVQLLRIGN